ncbi:2-amino-4-hydroxy-6-hydroxymethyldihydropteridine diphosphokinase [Cecembia rubra]|uniref:2-amino-4-hydroxy-6-hydroxymethyldihydropteridine pyrophosphokinase n=1 Tax=Cecembia rubra TaxID=1485585 RepID=A0A2P8DL37_9BACT|nr:2-amino-4-hydroxy-6-hydroxymethyldihydropteridine diphosphokinase [Cecembia rubra]PSK97919.1 2-amino-4-hydroxy-6-hydroxymethyldihydropteridine diphosphokinase [Cecembia rubra]
MGKLVLIIGGNLGDRLNFIFQATNLLIEAFGPNMEASSIYETEAWGGKSSGSYLNQVLVFQSSMKPHKVLEIIQSVENRLERKREVKWGNRTMDIDLLFYGDLCLDSKDLIVPHPFISQRRFVLEPLNELMPDFIHPSLKLKIRELLLRCKDNSAVLKYKKGPDLPG